MKHLYNHLRKDLSSTELGIGALSFIIGGTGLVFLALGVWNFALNILADGLKLIAG